MSPTRSGADLTDPTNLALAMKELEGRVELATNSISMLERSTSLANQNFSNTLASMDSKMDRLPALWKGELEPILIRFATVSETVASHRLGVRMLWAVVTLMVGAMLAVGVPLVSWWNGQINQKFDDARAERVRLENERVRAHDADVDRLEAQISDLRNKLEAR